VLGFPAAPQNLVLPVDYRAQLSFLTVVVDFGSRITAESILSCSLGGWVAHYRQICYLKCGSDKVIHHTLYHLDAGHRILPL